MTKLKVLDLFKSGMNTIQIADRLKITEASAYNRLQREMNRAFEAKGNIRSATKMRWAEKHAQKRKMNRRLRYLVPYAGSEEHP
jgi:transposase